ncbi:hypothetical protein Poli38472_011604 [Pythium oligandrum]|uniref:Uncharacterized protein n=1 Tax=Pythium oligandrum TaxID=41045 RepID=A0A8K1FKZ9_PYTOL|nr:hypothetical protein Poli38472_011604 [Pythium oligandrum]|eukprot:TMW64724.1 hypothetical protein Poli38472_011604 [Pythium oligandrum]
MVGFLRKNKSNKTMLSSETALDRKGRVDGSSLLDDNGDPTEGTLFQQNLLAQKRRANNEEEDAPQNFPAPPTYPPQNYPYGQTYPPQQGYGYPQQQPQQTLPPMNTGFGNGRGSFGNNSSAPSYPTQNQQYPKQYGASQQYGAPQQQYGAPQQYGQQQFGAPQQYGQQQYGQQQYPVQYGNYPPPYPAQPDLGKKKSFFSIPGYGKKK